MREQPRGDLRDTHLDVAEIGAQVRAQLESLAAQGNNTLVQKWLFELKQDPTRIQENFRTIFPYMRGLRDDDLEQKIDVWEGRLTEVN